MMLGVEGILTLASYLYMFMHYGVIVSRSFIHIATEASLGMRQSPRGERATLPTFGPSGRQERLNCWEKNLR